MSPDLVNGLFETLAGVFIFNHCRVLYRQKMVRGVSVLSTVFFFLWGVWNLFYYPNIAQDWSFRGGIVVMTANLLWITMMVYYRRRPLGKKRIPAPWPETNIADQSLHPAPRSL